MKHSTPSWRRQSGFALLITIVLVAFLVLLLVGLATFTRVETQVASNGQAQAKARQNALMALNLAVGRLQAAAGPDTRVTTTADLVAGRHIDKKNWTGVWKADATGAAEHVAWLVSGTAPAGSATANSALTAAAGNSLVELVGAGSTDITNNAVTGNRVRVETQPVGSDSVPGMTGPQTIGHFAYWVGDEGVKANVTLTDPWESPSTDTLDATVPPTTASQAQNYRFVNAQRIGAEGIGFDAADTTKLGTAANPIANPGFKNELPKVLGLTQLGMAGTTPAGEAALTAASRVRFHDLTADSVGLHVDVVRGGLKKDLTAWLAGSDSNPSGSAAALDDYIAQGDSADTIKFGLPKWALLRSYNDTRDTNIALDPRRQTDTQHGIAPVITYARMAFNVTAPPGGGLYKFHITPTIALWNPYNVPIKADPDGSFEFCVKYTAPNTPNNTLRLETQTSGNLDNPTRDHFDVNNISIYTNSAATSTPYGTGLDNQFWRFKVRLTNDLPAGESRLFTVDDDSDGDVYAIGESILSDAAVDSANSVHLPSRTPLTATQMLPASFIWLNTENGSGSNISQMELALVPRPRVALATAAAAEAYIRANACQLIQGYAVGWVANSNRLTLSDTHSGEVLAYQRFELNMSAVPLVTDAGSGSGVAGTPRWLANLNPQSPLNLRKPLPASNRIPSYVRHSSIRGDAAFAPDFPNTDGGKVSAGTRVSGATAQNLVIREFQPAGVPLLSLAQLQHANVSHINLNPTYPIGNSLANTGVPRINTFETLPDDGYSSFPNASFNRLYDLSYLLNQALWDSYFFSTVPGGITLGEAGNANYRLPNARHRFNWSAGGASAPELIELKTTSTAAKRLLLGGAFNVNSTSVQAWRALLYARNELATDPDDATKKHPYSRFTRPVTGAEPNEPWLGYRILSDAQIDALAPAIVAEVRVRGPFLSLASFVNRRLADDATGLKGPLQAAIDSTTGASAINTADPAMQITAYTAYTAADVPTDEQKRIYKGSTDTALPGPDGDQPHTSRAAFAPGFLTQADLLTAIGPGLAARSDTFRVRAYGDVINPAAGDTTPEARAWCEAIVQRLPDYVDSSMAAETDLASAPASPAKTTNETFGRRFKVVSFRWLSPDDL